MDGGFPLVMLIGPLLGAVAALAVGRRRRVSATVGLISVILLALLVWLAAPGAGIFSDDTAAFYGRELTLTPFSRGLFLLMYTSLAGLFALAWFRPSGRALVPAGLAVLSPLAAGVMVSSPGLGVVFIVVAAAVVVPALHGGRYMAAGAAWRYFLFVAVALAPALSAVSSLAAGPGQTGWVAALLAALMLLGGFPFHIWAASLGRAASPASLTLALGVAPLASVAILFSLLDGAPAARASAEFQAAVLWSAALTALAGAFLVFRATNRREAVAGTVVLDMGFLLPALLSPGADGLLLALPALISRTLSLLLIAAAWRVRPVVADNARFGRARAALPMVLLGYGLLSLLGLPLTPGFAGRWVQLLAAGQSQGQWATVLLGLALVLGALGLLRGLPRFARAHEAATTNELPAAPAEVGLLTLLLGVAVVCGVWPNLPAAVVSRMLGMG